MADPRACNGSGYRNLKPGDGRERWYRPRNAASKLSVFLARPTPPPSAANITMASARNVIGNWDCPVRSAAVRGHPDVVAVRVDESEVFEPPRLIFERFDVSAVTFCR